MGLLTLKTDVDHLKKAVISIWFRVSSDAADGARAIAVEDPLSRVMHGVVPFITWGEQQIGLTGTLQPVYQGAVEVGGVPITTQEYVPGGPDIQLSPSYIGLYVGSELNPQDPPQLTVNIQTQDFATGSGIFSLVTSWTGNNSGLTYHNPGSPYDGAPIYTSVVYHTTDNTNEMLARAPDYFGGIAPVGITFDKWHHLLISWDLDDRKMWCALDDEDQSGSNLPGLNDPAVMGPNDQLSNWEFAVDPALGESISLIVTTLPTNPVNVPGPAAVNYTTPEGNPSFKVPVQHVELAELQIFTDVSLDTEKKSSRRAFISSKGEPVPPTQKQTKDADGNVIKESGSIELLRKEPEIMLHGQNRWIKGNNTGTIGKDKDGNKKPAGQFKPTGTIKKYQPDPKLGK